MKQIEELLAGKAELDSSELRHLKNLASDWQIIADLSFADLAMWVPLKDGGFIAIAHVRAATAATVFPKDFVGEEVADLKPSASVEIFPVSYKNKREIAIITRHHNPGTSRSVGKLESAYQDSAKQLLRMVGEGTFPFDLSISALNPSPRVGDGFITLNKSGHILYASPNGRSAFSRLGWEGEIEALELSGLAHAISGEAIAELNERLSSNSISQITLDGDGAIVELTVLPLLTSGVRVGSIVLLHNVTEMRRRERELLLKDATIKEIHHRVKNNLQTVSALLRLQSRRVSDQKARNALDEAVRRISSIALVHETLSASGKENVDFDAVVDSLVGHAAELAFRAPGSVENIAVKRLGSIGTLDPKVATPLALIVTELVANAIEHGLTIRGSKVDVIFTRTGSSCVVKIEDDGVGLPADFDLANSSNLGLQIVRTLTENELQGSLEISSKISSRDTRDNGTSAILRFDLR